MALQSLLSHNQHFTSWIFNLELHHSLKYKTVKAPADLPTQEYQSTFHVNIFQSFKTDLSFPNCKIIPCFWDLKKTKHLIISHIKTSANLLMGYFKGNSYCHHLLYHYICPCCVVVVLLAKSPKQQQHVLNTQRHCLHFLWLTTQPQTWIRAQVIVLLLHYSSLGGTDFHYLCWAYFCSGLCNLFQLWRLYSSGLQCEVCEVM